jgi:hypothetical protein
MKRRSSQRIVALLLGVILALGMNLSAVQANDMAIDMVMCSDMDGCNDRGNESDCDGNGGACLSVCTTLTPAVLDPAVAVKTAEASSLPLPDGQSTYGRASSPDPHPPKSHDQG